MFIILESKLIKFIYSLKKKLEKKERNNKKKHYYKKSLLLESKKDEKQYFYIHLQRYIFNVLFLYDNMIVNMYVCVSKNLFFLLWVLVDFF